MFIGQTYWMEHYGKASGQLAKDPAVIEALKTLFYEQPPAKKKHFNDGAEVFRSSAGQLTVKVIVGGQITLIRDYAVRAKFQKLIPRKKAKRV